jgi:hypothetical protein
MANFPAAFDIRFAALQVQLARESSKNWAIKLTYSMEIAIVRRFREYPDRVVRETWHVAGWRKAHAR